MDEDGFALLPNFLDAATLEEIRPHVERLVVGPSIQGCRRPHNELYPLRWDSPIVEIALSRSSSRSQLNRAMGTRNPKWISGYISTKAPHSPPLWWHQDWWCWDHDVSYRQQPAQVAILCYLEATHIENGALRILPGTHKKSIPLHRTLAEAHSASIESLPLEHAVFRDMLGQITISAKPGDAVALDYRLLHGTHANGLGRRRDCIILNFAPFWSQLPDDIRGHLICHTALPTNEELCDRGMERPSWLPCYNGPRATLPLRRDAPAHFVAAHPKSYSAARAIASRE